MRAWLGGALVLLSACSRPPVDVVLITVDTLRVDHVSAYAPDGPAKTPNMDGLAEDGVIHTQAFSPVSVTAPAFASLMTGQSPEQHGVLMNQFRGGDPLSPDAVTLAERFAEAEAKYATAGFVSAYTLRRAVGLGQGFQVYNGGERANRWGDQTVSTALSWLESHRERPIFLWVHSYDPHGPVRRFAKPADRRAEWKDVPENAAHIPRYQKAGEITDPAFYAQMYVRGVQYADRQVGRVIEALKEQGRYEDALIIILADHGETLTERDLWFDHGTSAHVEQLHIPLIVKYPKNRRAGSHDDRLISLMDVTPTVLSEARLPALPDPAGVALTSSGTLHDELKGEGSHCKEVEVLKCRPRGGLGKELSVRSLAHTVVHQSRSPDDLRLFYNRTTDPKELQSASGGDAQGLSAILDAMHVDRAARTYADPPGSAAAQDSEEIQKLKKLGYVE